MSTPRLRFKEFGGKWIEKKLNTIMDKIGDGLHSTPIYDENGDYYFVNGNNLADNRVLVSEKTKRVGEIEFNKYKVNLNNRTILMSINGTIGNIAFYNGEKIILGKSACYLNLKSNENKSFIFNVFQTSKLKAHFEKELTGSTIKNLSLTTIKNAKIYSPTLQEQTKIANFLTAVDDKITQLTQKDDLLAQYKKGVMQQIFSQQLRFRDEDGREFPEWEEKKLSEIGDSFNGLTGKSGDDFGSGKSYITYKQIFDNSRIDITKFSFVQIGENEKQNTVKFGDIFFTTSSETPNEVGFCSVLLSPVNEEIFLNSFCFGYRIKSFELFNPCFASYLFKSLGFRANVVLLAQGSTRFNISKTEFMKIRIRLPSLLEQTKIANFLAALDEKINNNQAQLKGLKQYKQGLLQEMFV